MSDEEEEIDVTSITTDALVNQTTHYIKSLKEMIEHIKTAKIPEDRLAVATELAYCLNAVMMSIKGWGAGLIILPLYQRYRKRSLMAHTIL